MKNIAVFFGGNSVEHDVSVITGVLTANSLNKEKYNVVPIYVHNDGLWYTGESLLDIDNYKNLRTEKLVRVTLLAGGKTLYKVIKSKKLKPVCNVAVAINCMHGELGEDGSLAGLLNMCEVALASPSVMASAISMDKCFTKTAMKGLKVKTLPSVTVYCEEDIALVKKKLKYPLIVKPACLGSSIGISKAIDDDSLVNAINNALRFGEKVIVEPQLKNHLEINCSAYRLNEKVIVSECERPVGTGEYLTFDDKYTSGKRVFPADIDKRLSDKIKAITKKVYEGLSFNGIIRIDFFVSGEEIYLNEINSVPGSLAFYLFCDTLKEFSVLLQSVIIDAEKRYARSCTTKRKYQSGILMASGAKGAKRKNNR